VEGGGAEASLGVQEHMNSSQLAVATDTTLKAITHLSLVTGTFSKLTSREMFIKNIYEKTELSILDVF
jgi:hypothetical protein